MEYKSLIQRSHLDLTLLTGVLLLCLVGLVVLYSAAGENIEYVKIGRAHV